IGEAWFLETPGKPLVRKEIELADPAPTDVVVEVLACGLCHTDLSARAGLVPFPLPGVLGHEGSTVIVVLNSLRLLWR
ncbi:MAG: alcohol dehydrogenase catalytic domain-containing protein, partial [Verrucomicrobiota bacterium]